MHEINYMSVCVHMRITLWNLFTCRIESFKSDAISKTQTVTVLIKLHMLDECTCMCVVHATIFVCQY